MNQSTLSLIVRFLPLDATEIVVKERKATQLFFTSAIITPGLYRKGGIAVKISPAPNACYAGKRFRIEAFT